MAQRPSRSVALPSVRERIIPIEIEQDMPEESTSSRTVRQKPLKNVETEGNEEELHILATLASTCKGIGSLSLEKENERQNTSVISAFSNLPQKLLPNYNVPEKIIIALDRALDDSYSSFETTTGKKYNPLVMLQHALKLFLHNKSTIDNRHEFALVLLNENSCTWIHDFTNLPLDIIRSMQQISECHSEDIFQMNTLFDLVNEKIKISSLSAKDLIPPPFIVRLLLLYGRSYSIPQLEQTEDIEKLLTCPYFTFDCIMTHEPPSSANYCEKIFKKLQKIDPKGTAYSFAVARNVNDLHVAAAKVLSHPLQRPFQCKAQYSVYSFKNL